jgi:macrolide-specific efflux system membrane fusion protein
VKEWEQLFKPTPIIAPIAGTIIKKNVVAGQTFGTGDAVFTMSDHLTVNVQVDETDIGQIRLQQRAMITLDAYRDVQTLGKVFKIAFDSTTVNNVTTYVVDVLPDHIPPAMRSGMTANVVFDVQTKSDILVVPNGAIKIKNGQPYVLLSAKDETTPAPELAIQTGITDGKMTEITGGLKEGDEILVPEFKLIDNTTNVNPFSPMGRPAPKKVS